MVGWMDCWRGIYDGVNEREREGERSAKVDNGVMQWIKCRCCEGKINRLLEREVMVALRR